MKSRVELLAPAGNYEAFLGAINAGADAVYLGGEKFGARAYADNFTSEEICRAIHTAHFMGKKIYLTVNTLVKDSELAEMHGWLLPFYEAGLDGVIVQDMGVLCYIREYFRDLPLHASTQMSVTGTGGASFLKEQGAERIVPARELSLTEVRRIKEQTGLEIECFIHGAMCYCYSGQCLFSSILGGRSGNRGRCAQPCRLPYQIYEGDKKIGDADYPLSLKDMCTISYIPHLIEAGIDSFKIEGRMKKPEYAAGVTALYRKYIDLYEEKGCTGYHVTDEDTNKLQSLYIRSEVQSGYYERHNGKEMITLQKPGYVGSDLGLFAQIRTQYVKDVDRLPIKMYVTLKMGEPACLQIAGEQGTVVTVYGGTVDAAQNRPLKEENVRKQLEKTGNSLVKVSECDISIQGDVFMPVSALNELRRKGVEAFERQYIIEQGMLAGREEFIESAQSQKENDRPTKSVNKFEVFSDATPDVAFNVTPGATPDVAFEVTLDTAFDAAPGAVLRHLDNCKRLDTSRHLDKPDTKPSVDILVSTYEQLTVAVKHSCRRIYIDSDLYLMHHEQIKRCMEEHACIEYYLALPYVLRARDESYMQQLTEVIMQYGRLNNPDGHDDAHKSDAAISGFLVRNLEEVSYVRNLGQAYEIVPDADLYVFNAESMRFWSNYCREYTLPYELNAREVSSLVSTSHERGMGSTLIIYGRIPMMITANCIRKTAGRCAGVCSRGQRAGQAYLNGNLAAATRAETVTSGARRGRSCLNMDNMMQIRDRYGTDFPVETNCTHCYNVIYNSVPYSLHLQQKEIHRMGVDVWRCDFTTESEKECRMILEGVRFPYEKYTTGHLKRGVE